LFEGKISALEGAPKMFSTRTVLNDSTLARAIPVLEPKRGRPKGQIKLQRAWKFTSEEARFWQKTAVPPPLMTGKCRGGTFGCRLSRSSLGEVSKRTGFIRTFRNVFLGAGPILEHCPSVGQNFIASPPLHDPLGAVGTAANVRGRGDLWLVWTVPTCCC